jgi:hypothetical protein
METTERIVEAYCRYVKGWFTIPNIKCDGQYEIDLLAIDPHDQVHRYHIESGVSISGAHSKLTTKEFSPARLKVRVEQASQRRTLGYFIERKFGPPQIIKKLKQYGFEAGNYSKVIVTWGCTEEAKVAAEKSEISIWDFRDIIQEVGEMCRKAKAYFTDDTLRTLQLYERTLLRNRTR